MVEGLSPGILGPPANVFRLCLHPDGLASRCICPSQLANGCCRTRSGFLYRSLRAIVAGPAQGCHAVDECAVGPVVEPQAHRLEVVQDRRGG
jgi:hypothetical protein